MELDRFLIGFEGLKLGKYDYSFLVDNSFFKELGYSEIQEGNVVVDAVFSKSERLMEMDLYFKGKVIVPCDLCGEDLVQEILFEESVVITMEENQDEDEGIIVLGSEETEVNIGHYLYESISLNLPSKRVHPRVNGKPRCDEALLTKINPKQGDDNDDEIDPRWAALKKLK
jgi:uncharacterized metal-binding protein YceD (DUF177 family)